MIFNSFQFLWLFPLICILYYWVQGLSSTRKISPKVVNLTLLIISYLLYIQFNPAYALILLWVTAVTYWGARYLGDGKAHKSKYIAIGVILTILPLVVFKYYNFVLSSITSAMAFFGVHIGIPGLNWAIPLGISFFTFQALGYLLDVYYKRIDVEKNWWNYMLFVAFFPQILSGPISKASALLPQIRGSRTSCYDQAVQGLKYLLLGCFLKVVLADRIGVYVDVIYAQYSIQNGITLLLAAILYSFQIYGDFAGYSLMAVGTAKVLGFELINNFQRPYLSTSVTDFWRRWHISLSLWLKDYVYIPLGGSRKGKGRTYLNIIITFLVSGIWHGANWTFVVWGLMHGVFQTIEKALGWNKSDSRGAMRLLRIVFTFLLVTWAWIFFRMPTLESAHTVVVKIFTDFGGTIDWANASINHTIMFVSLAILIITELIEESGQRFSFINHPNVLLRWGSYLFLTAMILMCGVLDSSSFIYVNF